jgi:hypothetical protein
MIFISETIYIRRKFISKIFERLLFSKIFFSGILIKRLIQSETTVISIQNEYLLIKKFNIHLLN